MRYRILTEDGAWIYGRTLTDCLEVAIKRHLRVTDVQIRDYKAGRSIYRSAD